MTTVLHFFPFDLFGSPGTRAGVELLADALRELLAENRRESVPTRSRAYAKHVHIEEWALDKLADYQNWREQAEKAIRSVRARGDFLIWIAGNHLGVLPVYDDLSKDADKTLVLQLDAHLDIHNLSDCTAELSHGNFLLHARKPRPRLINVGHRDLLLRPEYIAKYYDAVFSAERWTAEPEHVLDTVRAAVDDATQVFIDLDCDVFDVAYFPGVAQALPMGLPPLALLRFLEALDFRKVIGFSISEFDTARDVRDQSLATLVWLLEWVLLRVHERR